jgi:hypothetical protein
MGTSDIYSGKQEKREGFKEQINNLILVRQLEEKEKLSLVISFLRNKPLIWARRFMRDNSITAKNKTFQFSFFLEKIALQFGDVARKVRYLQKIKTRKMHNDFHKYNRDFLKIAHKEMGLLKQFKMWDLPGLHMGIKNRLVTRSVWSFDKLLAEVKHLVIYLEEKGHSN